MVSVLLSRVTMHVVLVPSCISALSHEAQLLSDMSAYRTAELLKARLKSDCVDTCYAQADQENSPESTYQAQFDTVAGEWATVRLPWHEFVPVKRAQVSSPTVPPIPMHCQLGVVKAVTFVKDGYNADSRNSCTA